MGRVASFIGQCQSPTGGFGGGPGQLPHLAPTYAAVSALVIAGSNVAYKIVDRSAMYDFLMRMKSPEGGFTMHEEGETDMRGTYCAIAVASMLHMLTDELMERVPEYVRRCQTYEGGIAGEEGLEAHGGYSYCGLAAVCIMGKAHALDLHGFLNWAAHRQITRKEGSRAGQTNLWTHATPSGKEPSFQCFTRLFGSKAKRTSCYFHLTWPGSPLAPYKCMSFRHASIKLVERWL